MSRMLEYYHRVEAILHVIVHMGDDGEILCHQSLLFTQMRFFDDGCIVFGDDEFITHKNVLTESEKKIDRDLHPKLILKKPHMKLMIEFLDKKSFGILNKWIKE